MSTSTTFFTDVVLARRLHPTPASVWSFRCGNSDVVSTSKSEIPNVFLSQPTTDPCTNDDDIPPDCIGIGSRCLEKVSEFEIQFDFSAHLIQMAPIPPSAATWTWLSACSARICSARFLAGHASPRGWRPASHRTASIPGRWRLRARNASSGSLSLESMPAQLLCGVLQRVHAAIFRLSSVPWACRGGVAKPHTLQHNHGIPGCKPSSSACAG